MPRRNRTADPATGLGRRWLPTGEPLAPLLPVPPPPDLGHVRRPRDDQLGDDEQHEQHDEREQESDTTQPDIPPTRGLDRDLRPRGSTPCQVTRNMYGFHIPETGNELRMSESAS